jgi:integrase
MAKRRPNGAGMDPVKRKDGRYAARVYMLQPDGTTKAVWVYDRDYQECIRKRDELLSKKREEIPVPSRSATLGEWLDYWLEHIVLEERPYTTYAKYEGDSRLYLKPLLGSVRLRPLSVAQVRALKNQVKREKGAAKAKDVLVTLRSALTAAMREDVLTRNVAQLVEFPEVDREEAEPWSPEEARAFFRGARGHQFEAAFLLIILVGLRGGEIRGLRWSDIDLEDRTIRIHRQRQKIWVPGREVKEVEYRVKGKGRLKKNRGHVGLPVAMIRPLMDQRDRQADLRKTAGGEWEDQGLVFTNRQGGPLSRDTFYKSYSRLAARLGLRHVPPHGGRHGVSTTLADLGVHPHVNQAIMGHSSAEMTMGVYTHVALEAQREALDRVGDLLSGHEDVNDGCQEEGKDP